MPNIFGEDAVLRVLDKQSLYESTQQQLALDSLGSSGRHPGPAAPVARALRHAACHRAPPAAAKTTRFTPHHEINNGQDKIVTRSRIRWNTSSRRAADPGQRKKGSPFARGLRSILRHDPDKIMVGEIRDPETANMRCNRRLPGTSFLHRPREQRFDVIGRFMH